MQVGCDRVLDVRGMSRFGAVLALAWAGTTTGHFMGYALSHPAAAERGAWLRSTGHGSFDVLLVLAATAGAAALAIAALRTRDPLMRVGSLAARLLVFQLAMFSFLEIAERGFDLSRALNDPAVLWGLLLQAATALGLAFLARGAQQTARALIRRLQVPHPRAPQLLPSPGVRTEIAARPSLFRHARRRAPPLPLTT
jgi:hypothetical protein